MDRYSRERALLFSGIAEQKRKYLKRCIAEAEKNPNAAGELKNAVKLVSKAKYARLEGAVPEAISLGAGGRKSADFDMRKTPPCDGILLSVDYEGRSDESTLTVGVGTDNGFSYIEDIPLPVDGGKLWLSYDLFTPAPKGAERLVVALVSEEDTDVRVTPEYFFREIAEEDKRTVYTETPANELCNTKFYKINDVSNGRALALVPRIREVDLRWNESLIHTDKGQHIALEANAHDYVQQWQLFKTEYGKYHIINKSNANHLQLDENGKAFPADVDMNNPAQDFDILPAGPGKFTIYGMNKKPLVCDYAKSGIWSINECAYGEWVMTFEDEFDGPELDRSIWGVYNAKIRPDCEPVMFLDRPENFYTEDGNLVIRSLDDGYDQYPLTAAYMDTRGLYGITYGKMEMRARIGTGAWIWPAFWSMGIVGNWPYQGEIDVMELVGGGEHGELDSQVFGTLHWATEVSQHMEKGVTFRYHGEENLNDRYHTYAAEWEYDHIRLYEDDMLYMAMHMNSDGKKWGFGDNPHYLILNTSVRGPGQEKAYPDTAKESLYYIDWVRCYKRAGEVTPCDNLATDAKKPDYINGVANEWLNKVCASSDGKYVAAAGQGGVVYIYDQKEDKLLYSFGDPQVAVEAIGFTPDGSKLVVPSRDSEIFIYDCSNLNAKPIRVENIGTFHEFVTFTPDGSAFLSGGRDTIERGMPNAKNSRALRLWTIGGKPVAEVETGSDVRNAAVSPDGKLVAAVCSDGSMRVYEYPELKEVFRFNNENESAMRGVDFSADGLLAFSDEAGTVYFCDVASKKVRTAAKVNPSSVRRVRFNPAGDKLLALCADNCARLFDAETGELAALLGGFTEMLGEAKFSADGSRIAVASYDGTLKIFDSDGAFISAYKTENPLGRWIMDIAFSADGKRIFAAMGIMNTDYCVWDI